MIRKEEKICLAVFDIGGIAVKYGLGQNRDLEQKGKFSTPSFFMELKESLVKVIQNFDSEVSGLVTSSYGTANVNQRTIDEVSAISYIHNHLIYDELEDYLGLLITIKNDVHLMSAALRFESLKL